MSVSNEWELSKENILPIVGGRKPDALRSALSVHPDDHLLQKKRAFEQELRAYDGDDPLSVWCEYIKWVEQNYVKGGKEGSLNRLVQQCLSILKDEEKYQNDDRFIDIWLKFTNMVVKPSEVYLNMYQRNIGCKVARFFIAWAWEMEQLGNLKRADEILLEGIHRNAQPIDELKMAHSKLEARLVQVFAGSVNNSPGGESEPEHRSAFTLLKTQEKNRAPIMRIGPMTLPASRENMVIGHSQPQPRKQQQVKVPFKIFNAENIPPAPMTDDQAPVFALNPGSTKENEKKPSKWSKVKVPSSAGSIRPRAPEFVVHSDNTAQPCSVKKDSTHDHVLTQRKKLVDPPLFLAEKRGPNEHPMYDFEKVYCGTEEYSFEEIRAAKWFAKQRKLEKEKKRLEDEKEKQEMKEQLLYLQKRLFELERKVVHTESSDSQTSALAELSSAASKNVALPSSVVHEHMPIVTPESSIHAIACVGNPHDNAHIPSIETSHSLKENINQPNRSTTTIVKNIFHDLYNDTCRSNFLNDNSTVDLPCEKIANVDDIVTIRTPEHGVGVSKDDYLNLKNTALKTEPEKKSVFTIYHDSTEEPPKTSKPLFEIFCEDTEQQNQAIPLNFQTPIMSSEDIENIPPSDYVQPQERRELCGILQPSRDILFIPLEEQLEQEGEEELDDNDDLAQPLPSCEDMTIVPPLSKDHFDLDARFASTPCVKIAQNLNSEKEEPGDLSEKVVQPDEESKFLVQTLNECLCVNKCPRIQELISNTIEKVQGAATNQSKNTNLKMASDYLQTCVQINKEYKLHSMLSRAVSLMESYAKKLRTPDDHQPMPYTSQQSWQLSIIMENSREGSTKSSSSSSLSSISRIKNFSSIHRTTPSDFGTQSYQSTIIESPSGSEVSYPSTNFDEVFLSEEPVETYSFDCNPFSDEVTGSLLGELPISIASRKNFHDMSQVYLKIKVGNEVKLGDITCIVDKQFASGAYAKIYAASIVIGNLSEVTHSLQEAQLALKVCKNANEWEFYICSELSQRLTDMQNPPDVSDSIMKVRSAVRLQKSIVLVSNLSEYGTLLDIVNLYKLRSAKVPEYVVLYFTLELLLIVSCMHECSIIHCDIKPDNILINRIQTNVLLSNLQKGKTSCLQLIDFGRAIDLSFFKPGIVFNTKVCTSSFQCSEMKEGKPWVYQIDWFGVMGCIHVLLFSEYMSVQKNCHGMYELGSKFRRYWQVDIWQPLFQTFLNIPSCYSKPNVKPFVHAITKVLQKQSRNFINQMQELSSILPAKL